MAGNLHISRISVLLTWRLIFNTLNTHILIIYLLDTLISTIRASLLYSRGLKRQSDLIESGMKERAVSGDVFP